MRYFLRLLVAVFLLSVGCGQLGDLFDSTVPLQTDPYVTRISPVAATAGDTVTVFGYGFSDVAELNVVIIGASAVVATSYSLVTPPVAGEIEAITFTVPAGLAIGANSIYVDVLDNVSNTNVSITIN